MQKLRPAPIGKVFLQPSRPYIVDTGECRGHLFSLTRFKSSHPLESDPELVLKRHPDCWKQGIRGT